jgi:uncharacterized protein
LTTSKKALIVFQKNAILGKVKSRLAQDIGTDQALKVYQALLALTYNELRKLQGLDLWIYYSDFIESEVLTLDTGKVFVKVQEGLDLGDKMYNAFGDVFQHGYKHAVIIGTDCPEINTELIEKSFEVLASTHQAVIGPALDGGYYLLGSNALHSEIFKEMSWSTSSVAHLTLRRLQEKAVVVAELPILRDIDHMEDYQQTKALLEKFMP